MFNPTLQTKCRADLVFGDGVRMHLLGYCLCIGVWSGVNDVEVSSKAMLAEPSAEFCGYFDRYGYVRKLSRDGSEET